MKTARVRTSDYTRAGHAAFQQKFSLIAHGILSHPEVFSGIPVPPSELAAMAKSLANKTDEAGNGGSRNARNERNIIRASATGMLNKLATGVALIASGAATEEARLHIIQLAKFAVKKTKYTRTGGLGKVERVKATWTGNKGQAFVRWKRIRSGASYNIEIKFSSPGDAATEWQFVKSTSRRKTFIENLPYLSTSCWVRATAIGARNRKSAPSSPALIAIG